MSSNSTSFKVPNITSTLSHMGFKPLNPNSMLDNITNSFLHFIGVMFDWVYLLSEIGIIVGALVFVVGAFTHHSRIKSTGARIALFSVLGFVIALVAPGIVIALQSQFHHP